MHKIWTDSSVWLFFVVFVQILCIYIYMFHAHICNISTVGTSLCNSTESMRNSLCARIAFDHWPNCTMTMDDFQTLHINWARPNFNPILKVRAPLNNCRCISRSKKLWLHFSLVMVRDIRRTCRNSVHQMPKTLFIYGISSFPNSHNGNGSIDINTSRHEHFKHMSIFGRLPLGHFLIPYSIYISDFWRVSYFFFSRMIKWCHKPTEHIHYRMIFYAMLLISTEMTFLTQCDKFISFFFGLIAHWRKIAILIIVRSFWAQFWLRMMNEFMIFTYIFSTW